MALGQQRHTSGTSDAQSHIQQCPLNCVFRNTCAWTYIVSGCQLSHCRAPILLYQEEQSPTSFFFDDAWTTNTLASTADVTVIYPLCMNTNNGRSLTTYQWCSFGDTRSESSGHYDLPSIKFA
ncbi:hypothetical protein AVEN_152045-1 [Araneus ventricosus]|uniref:Uncharacterized protein n=1 Tax=Araneus ventricosus TaxID=182803 RepID=A0A4Y2WHA1_ARAVE|nr:hypothetical protein AVEN_152045-1 [Araneus ventricosus]